MKKTKLDTLLIIRGLLAISVVVWHIGSLNGNAPSIMVTPGRTAVWFFFGISGYVISYGFLTKRYHFNFGGLKIFYINRFLRIYPLFLLLSLLTLFTEYVMTGKYLIGIQDIPSQLFMLQFNHEYVLSGVFWTLGIEVQFYLLAPLLVLLFMKKIRNDLFVCAAVYCLLVCWLPFAFYFLNWSFDGRNLLSNLSHFFAGMIACKMILGKKYPRVNGYVLVGAIIAMIILTNYFYNNSIKFYWTLGSVLIDLCIFLAVILHADLEQKNIQQTGGILKGLTLLGVISYGVYAWHPYLVRYIPYFERHVFLAVIATVLVAYISYKAVEKPILKFKKLP